MARGWFPWRTVGSREKGLVLGRNTASQKRVGSRETCFHLVFNTFCYLQWNSINLCSLRVDRRWLVSNTTRTNSVDIERNSTHFILFLLRLIPHKSQAFAKSVKKTTRPQRLCHHQVHIKLLCRIQNLGLSS